MKYNCKLILIFFFSFLSSFGQDKLALDSLTSQLQSTSVKVKVKALNELCRLYTGTDNKKAMYFAKQALQISVKAKNALLIGQSQNRLGTIYDYIGVLDSANINYLSALKIFEDLNDKSGIAAVYQNIGVMYYFQNDLEKAIVYYSKAIDLRNETNELDFVAKLQNNIAVILRRQEKYDEAIAYYNKALAIKLKFNDNEAIASSYANLGTAYLYKKDFVNARIFFEKALTINTKLNSKINLAGNYFSLGELFFNQGKYNEARENTHRSIELATEAQSNDVLYNDYDLLWQIDTAIGDYKSAASNVHIAGTYKAKVFKNEKAQAVEKLNVLYETEKKDKEIITLNAEQEKEKIWTQLLLIGFGLVIIILMITAVYFKKLQAKNKLLLFQKKEIEDKTQQLNQQASEIAQYRSQMNPHFIFNALVSIQKFILKENKFNAVDYLTRLSKLMRLTLYNSEKEYISIKDEKQFLEFYLGFEQA
ncbi:MAG: tetratricopeptide repeat protein, partial [Bacteroidia bacterium]